jgi:hypothetical protein
MWGSSSDPKSNFNVTYLSPLKETLHGTQFPCPHPTHPYVNKFPFRAVAKGTSHLLLLRVHTQSICTNDDQLTDTGITDTCALQNNSVQHYDFKKLCINKHIKAVLPLLSLERSVACEAELTCALRCSIRQCRIGHWLRSNGCLKSYCGLKGN